MRIFERLIPRKEITSSPVFMSNYCICYFERGSLRQKGMKKPRAVAVRVRWAPRLIGQRNAVPGVQAHSLLRGSPYSARRNIVSVPQSYWVKTATISICYFMGHLKKLSGIPSKYYSTIRSHSCPYPIATSQDCCHKRDRRSPSAEDLGWYVLEIAK